MAKDAHAPFKASVFHGLYLVPRLVKKHEPMVVERRGNRRFQMFEYVLPQITPTVGQRTVITHKQLS